MRPATPSWAAEADRALSAAVRRVRVIATSTPQNLVAELARLEETWARSGPSEPRFLHAERPDHSALRAALGALAERMEVEGDLGRLYAARAIELSDEAAICEGVGTGALWEAARRRFAWRDGHDDDADDLAEAWLMEAPPAEPATEVETETVRSDDERHPGSLLRRMRQEVGARRLPVRVMVVRDMASLAATGDGVVQVAGDRALCRRDVERTVLHELEGHVLPNVRAAGAALGLFALGTARGSDDQEGRALAIERRAGFLSGSRRRELALRHLAARSVEGRAEFAETTALLSARGAPVHMALRIAARAHRGGGLAREAVYLPALLRVEAACRADAGLDEVLASGKVAVTAAPALAAFAT